MARYSSFRITALVLLLILGLARTGLARQDGALEARVDRYVQPYLDTGNFSGSLLVARNGNVLLSRAYGLADVEGGVPNTPQTAFHLASVSRTFTSVATMLLVQRGAVSLSDSLATYLPDWPRGGDITIHHLLSLSAGFPNINELPGYSRWQRSPQTPETLVAKFRDLPLEFEPGTRSVHSNSNYNVLALIIERVSGQSFGDFLQTEIFTPLDMSRSGHHGIADQPIAAAAKGYAASGLKDLQPAPVIDWSVKTGNASIYSSTEDMLRFDRALADGALLDAEHVELLFTEYFPNNSYGWFVGERFGSREVYLNGGSPGFGSYWSRSLDSDTTVVVLGNLYNGVANTIGRDLMAMALDQEFEPPAFSAIRPDPALLAEIAGAYQFGPDFYQPNGVVNFSVRDGHLFNGRYWVMPTTTSELLFLHRRYWSDLEFKRDADGNIVELHYDGIVGKKQ